MLAKLPSRPSASNPSTVAPALVVGAVIELEQWGVEALRMDGQLTNFVEAEKLLVCAPQSVWERLKMGAAFSVEASAQLTMDKQFDALQASAITTQADIVFSRGYFHRARQVFERAKRAWSRAGNGYWVAYCAIGAADSDLHLGELTKAREIYGHVQLGNVISGWSEWIDFWPALHLKDIERITQPSQWVANTDDSKLTMLLIQRGDSDVAAIAAVLSWTKSWADAPEAFDSIVDRYRQIVRRRWWRPIDRVGLKLLFVEFLLYAGRLESAERVVQEVRREAEEKQAELFALRARILSLETDRRQGKPVHWRGVFAHCERRHYSLGVAYVLAIALADGQRPPSDKIRCARRWSADNGLHWLKRRLKRLGSSGRVAAVPLRFPYCYM